MKRAAGGSARPAVVEVQQTAQPGSTPDMDASSRALIGRQLAIQKSVSLPLVIPLVVVTLDELLDHSPHGVFAEGNDAVEALFFDAPNPTFREGIQVRGLRRKLQDLDGAVRFAFDLRGFKDVIERRAELAVAVMDEVPAARAVEESGLFHGDRARGVLHPFRVGVGRNAAKLDPS